MKNLILLLSFLLLTAALKPGDIAPNFTSKNHNSELKSLKDIEGSYVILYFYPMDNTIFCSKQAKAFNELVKEFAKLDTIIWGISRDNVERHKKFHDKYSLQFDLIVDDTSSIRNSYDIKNILERTTYLIDVKNKRIVKTWPNASFRSNASEVLKYLQDKSK